MNQACVHNDTIDAGNHHGRPQYRPFLRFLTTQERNVIWLLLAIAFLPVDGTTLGLYAPFWSPISPALFAVYCLCNWRQLRIAANRYLPMFLLPVACIILSIPGWLKFGIHLNAAFMSITGLLGVLADSRLSSIAENGAEGDGSFFARIYQSLDPIRGLLAHPWTVLTGYGAGNIKRGMGRREACGTIVEWPGHEWECCGGLRDWHECGHRMDDVCVYQRRRRIRIDRPGSAGHRFHSFHDARLRYGSCRAWCLEQDCYLLACPDRVPVYPVRELRVCCAAISEMRRVSLLRVQWSRPARTAAPRYLYARRQSMAVYVG